MSTNGPPEILDKIADVVLAYKPTSKDKLKKHKKKKSKKRAKKDVKN